MTQTLTAGGRFRLALREEQPLQIIGTPPALVNPEVAVTLDSVTPVALAGLDGQNAFRVSYTITNTGRGPGR